MWQGYVDATMNVTDKRLLVPSGRQSKVSAPLPVVFATEATNYNRLSYLLIAGASSALRHIFDRIHPPAGLHLVFDRHPEHVTLQSLRQKKIINPTQWEKLFPKIPSTVSSASFDMTLLMVLLRNICGLKPPINGWDSLPPAADASIEANIARVKYYRNTVYGHASRASVDDATFNAYWQGISNALVALGGASYEAVINKLKNECMDPDTADHYRNLLAKWKEDEDSIKEKHEETEENNKEKIEQTGIQIIEESEVRVSGSIVCVASWMPQTVELGHCALMRQRHQWIVDIKCRPPNSLTTLPSEMWMNLSEVYPDAKVEVEHNSVIVTLPPLQEDLEIAAFGSLGEKDMKRMQMAVFGRRPTNRREDWFINVVLYDDTVEAFQQVCQEEEERGNKLLTARAGLFVANINDDIKIELSALQPDWQFKESKITTIQSRYTWNWANMPTAFFRCHFTVGFHPVEKTENIFLWAVTVSHGADTATAELMAVFEQENDTDFKGQENGKESKDFKATWIHNKSHEDCDTHCEIPRKERVVSEQVVSGNVWNLKDISTTRKDRVISKPKMVFCSILVIILTVNVLVIHVFSTPDSGQEDDLIKVETSKSEKSCRDGDILLKDIPAREFEARVINMECLAIKIIKGQEDDLIEKFKEVFVRRGNDINVLNHTRLQVSESRAPIPTQPLEKEKRKTFQIRSVEGEEVPKMSRGIRWNYSRQLRKKRNESYKMLFKRNNE